MTISILALDPETGDIGGAAATGSLCVGGWVLRADPLAGASASQGAAPSTFWGEDVLALMKAGESARDAVATVTARDAGREARQLSALDLSGAVGAFTGRDNTAHKGARCAHGLVVAGNLLTNTGVLDAAAEGFTAAAGDLPRRLFAALRAAGDSGGDSRGFQSAALLVVGRKRPRLTLRVDYSETPLDDLDALAARAAAGEYAAWLDTVPVLADPERRGD